jgi:lipoyl(octanoyl) transferase
MIFEDWGLIDYQKSFDQQKALVEQIAEGAAEERIVFCTHPAVVTLGRGSKPEDILGWKGELVEINRGGKATYHGPSQLVIYPLIDLTRIRSKIPVRDVAAYLRALETWMIDAFNSLGLESKAVVSPEGSENSFTGVWVNDKKVASIGIAVRKWITHHGAAINLSRDPLAFTGINPCGFEKEVMSSLEQELGKKVSYEEMKKALIALSQW